MKKFTFVTIIICVASLLALPALAELRLPKIFTDNMVLQQELPIAVWGWADVDEEVSVEFAGQKKSATADKNGKWILHLDPIHASAESRALTVYGSVEKKKLQINNLLVGEVWLCAGQSNMNRDEQVKESDPDIRLFWIDGSTVPMKDDLGDAVAGWVESTPHGVASAAPYVNGRDAGKQRHAFAEVGYVFGRKIQKELKVPVGLIKSAFGGSTVEAWTPLSGFEEKHPFGTKVEQSYVGHVPGLLYQSMTHGIVPLTMRGVIWYQGEDDGRNREYAAQMKTWIKSWRKLWGRDDMPFYFVQIAQTGYASGMLGVWEAQVEVMHSVDHTGLAVSNDIYDDTTSDKFKTRIHEGNDREQPLGWPIAGGSNPHPPNKQLVANRLADIALVKTYGQPERVVYGPMYDSHKIEDGRVLVKFKYAGSGLEARDGKELNWFEISDGSMENNILQYKKAQVKIIAIDTVAVSCPDIQDPKFVRFAWHQLARHNLVNKEGLPAVSFRTDDLKQMWNRR